MIEKTVEKKKKLKIDIFVLDNFKLYILFYNKEFNVKSSNCLFRN